MLYDGKDRSPGKIKIMLGDDQNEYYPKEVEEVDEACPECKSPKIYKSMRSNGPDDYTMVYECKNCGCTTES